MIQNRRTVPITLRAHELQRHLTDPSVKIMVFCALGNTGVQEIVFPHQSELKVNGLDVKANLRGLKNKPGSTRPVDITSLLRQRPPNYPNTVEFTYAMTNKVSRPSHSDMKHPSFPTSVKRNSRPVYRGRGYPVPFPRPVARVL